MKALERLKEHPLRYAVPWSMTIARPILGEWARREAMKGNWGKATIIFCDCKRD